MNVKDDKHCLLPLAEVIACMRVQTVSYVSVNQMQDCVVQIVGS